MSYSPQDPNAAFLLSMLDDVTTQSPAAAPLEMRNASRDFLLELDRNPAAAPATPVEHATALLLQWSKASVRGDQANADSLAHKIEAAAPASPFPLHQTLRAHIDANVVAALAPGQSSYIPYNGNLSFGVIAGTLPDDAKIGIIGDWGTGEEDATFLLDSLLDRHGDIAALLHIGDIYETGRQSEVQTKFLTPIQTALANHKMKIPVFAIPGDHEYLSHGGAGYYWMLGEINKWDSKWLQEASYFCLRTKGGLWQILGGDTGYASRAIQPGFHGGELQWHQDKLTNFTGKTLFMTHRQFVSAYDTLDGQNYNDALVADMQALLPNINLFLWGHEHSFVPFVDQLQVPAYQSPLKAKLRTMGGSARHPYDQSPSTTGAKLIRTPPQKPGGNDYDWVDSANGHDNHTYAILDLGASTATYYQVTAWKLGDSNPVKSAPKQPVLVDQL